jgi:hypothetical protein
MKCVDIGALTACPRRGYPACTACHACPRLHRALGQCTVTHAFCAGMQIMCWTACCETNTVQALNLQGGSLGVIAIKHTGVLHKVLEQL